MRMAVEEAAGGSSHVRVETDMLITGRVAQMGRGIMQDVATRMIGEMARCMESRLSAAAQPTAAPPAAAASAVEDPSGAAAAAPAPPPTRPAASKPVGGISLLASVLWQRFLGLFRRRS
jgi:hypothetical protein